MCLHWNSSCFHLWRNHIDSPWHWLWLCFVWDPPPALCPLSPILELLLWVCRGPALPGPGGPVPDPGGAAGPEGPLSTLEPFPWCLELGPSFEETFCRKRLCLVTASQPSGPSSELRIETMVSAILRSESEMWTGEAEKEQRGGVWESVLRQRGRRKRESRKEEVGGEIGFLQQSLEG